MAPRAPAAFIDIVHKNLTPTRCFILYVITTALLLGIIVPVFVSLQASKRSAHRAELTDLASGLVEELDQNLGQFHGTVQLFLGFVASAAPLRIPDYFSDSIARRTQITTAPGTPTALTQTAYLRVIGHAAERFRGFRNALVLPGFINTFTKTGLRAGDDALFNTTWIADEMTETIQTAAPVVRGPLWSNTSQSVLLSVHTPVFNTTAELSRNRAAVDPLTRHHPNYAKAWGAVSVYLDLSAYARATDLPTRVGDVNHFLFQSLPRERLKPLCLLNIDNSTDVAFFDDAISACSSIPEFDGICFMLQPKTEWRGKQGAVLATVVLSVVFGSLVLVGVFLGVLRFLAGPRRAALKHLPRSSRFYALCVDMTEADAMWSNVPYIMNEITSIFDTVLEKYIEEHQAFLAVRSGNTYIMLSSSQHKIMSLAQRLASWAQNHTWPSHILVHAERSSVDFSFILHVCERSTLRVSTDGTTCEMVGTDSPILMHLRHAAIPGHIICTAQFRRALEDRNSEEYSIVTSERGSENVLNLRIGIESAHELGLCQIPITDSIGDTHQTTITIKGFLLPSAATEGRALGDILDTLPDEIWSEWRSPRERDDDLHRYSPIGETIVNPFHRVSSMHSSRGGPSATSTSEGTVLALPNIHTHLYNETACERLPGSAVALHDARRLAISLVAILPKKFESWSTSIEYDIGVGQELTGATHLQEYLSLATYFLVAYRFVFAPIDRPSLDKIVAKISTRTALGADDFAFELAARCARMTQHCLFAGESAISVPE
jgi:hypothetical protein